MLDIFSQFFCNFLQFSDIFRNFSGIFPLFFAISHNFCHFPDIPQLFAIFSPFLPFSRFFAIFHHFSEIFSPFFVIFPPFSRHFVSPYPIVFRLNYVIQKKNLFIINYKNINLCIIRISEYIRKEFFRGGKEGRQRGVRGILFFFKKKI